jgi:hypothetical protein
MGVRRPPASSRPRRHPGPRIDDIPNCCPALSRSFHVKRRRLSLPGTELRNSREDAEGPPGTRSPPAMNGRGEDNRRPCFT